MSKVKGVKFLCNVTLILVAHNDSAVRQAQKSGIIKQTELTALLQKVSKKKIKGVYDENMFFDKRQVQACS